MRPNVAWIGPYFFNETPAYSAVKSQTIETSPLSFVMEIVTIVISIVIAIIIVNVAMYIIITIICFYFRNLLIPR